MNTPLRPPVWNILICIASLILMSGCGAITASIDLLSVQEANIQSISGKALATSTDGGLPTLITCSIPAAELYTVASDGSISTLPIQSVAIAGDGTYQFSNVTVKAAVANLASSPVQFLVRINYCDRAFSRPVTDVINQNVSVASTLLEVATTTVDAGTKKFSDIQASTAAALITSLSTNVATNLKDSFDEIVVLATQTEMRTVFGVSTFAKIKDFTPPSTLTVAAPGSYAEMSLAAFTVTAWHWYYHTGLSYDWKWDNVVQAGHTNAHSFTPGKNTQGPRVLGVVVGIDDGGGLVDLTKGTTLKNLNLTIPNTFPAIVPVLTLTSAANTTSRNVTLNLATGSTPTGREYCETFTNMALTEQDLAAPILSSAYTLTCDTDQDQAIPFTLTSTGDGLKYLRLWARDSAGNISATPEIVQVMLDTSTPVVTIANLPVAIKDGSINNVTFTYSDLPSGNLDTVKLYYSADGITYIEEADLTLSPYIWTAPSGVDVATAYLRIIAVDKAGHSAQATTAAFQIIDTLPVTPVVTLLSASPTNLLLTSIGITCDAGYAKTMVSESATAPLEANINWATCATPIAYTLTNTADGSHTLYVWAKDAAGNISLPGTVTVVLDRTPPVLTLDPMTGPYLGGSTQIITWVATDANFAAGPVVLQYTIDGTTWVTLGTTHAAADSYSWVLPSANTAIARVRAIATDSFGQATTTTSAAFTIDSTPPNLAATFFTINSGATTATSNFVLTSFRLTDNFGVQAFCVKFDDTTPPLEDDSCWESVTSPLAGGQAIASTVNIANYLFQLGYLPNSYEVYVWAKDQVGLISSLSPLGTGTLARDHATINYDPGQPPLISSLDAVNKTNPSAPPVPADLSIAAGNNVFIRWTASNTPIALPATAVSLFYKLNSASDWTAIATAQGISNATHGCVADDPATTIVETGCYMWPSGSPSSLPYQIQIRVTNSTGQTSTTTSGIINGVPVRTLAGNTDPGMYGSAKASIYFPEGINESTSVNQFAVAPNGNIYIFDYRGLFRIKPADGMNKLFIKNTGTISGLGGVASAATLEKIYAINIDYSGNLLVRTQTAVIRIPTTVEDPTLTLLIGRGAQNLDGVTPLNFQFNQSGDVGIGDSLMTLNYPTLIPLPNGNIYFNDSNNTKLRYLDAASNTIKSAPLNGNGVFTDGSLNIAPIYKFNYGFSYDKFTSALDYVLFTGVNDSGGNNWVTSGVRVEPLTFTSLGDQGAQYNGMDVFPDAALYWGVYSHQYGLKTGLDGNLYTLSRNDGYIAKLNKATNAFEVIAGDVTNGQGNCADGVAATSCGIFAQDIFVSSTGTIYFLDAGRIRTIQRNGTVYTIYGAPVSAGDGYTALAARITSANIVQQSSDGSLQILQNLANVIREIKTNGVISTVAGNGNRAAINTALAPTASALYGTMDFAENTSFIIDPVSDDILMGDYNGIYRLSRTVGSKWVQVVGGGAVGPIETADGQNGNQINAYVSDSRLYGIVGNKVYYAYRRRLGGDEFSAIKAYDMTSNYKQEAYIGETTFGQANCGYGGTALGCRSLPDPGSRPQGFFNATGSILFVPPPNGPYVITYSGGLFTGADLTTADPATTISSSGASAYRKILAPTVDEIVYYCNGTSIVQFSLTNGTYGLLTWPTNDIKCTGQNMVYDSVNNRLIFFYKQNNLTALGEYQF
jgi:hypothetical protein